jgi:hypothetical protein
MIHVAVRTCRRPQNTVSEASGMFLVRD